MNEPVRLTGSVTDDRSFENVQGRIVLPHELAREEAAQRRAWFADKAPLLIGTAIIVVAAIYFLVRWLQDEY